MNIWLMAIGLSVLYVTWEFEGAWIRTTTYLDGTTKVDKYSLVTTVIILSILKYLGFALAIWLLIEGWK